jgi:Ni/Fe-hydrogenase b-type cytochrome subunit
VPQIHAPAIQAIDWTVIKADGTGATTCRGIEGSNTITDLVTGYSPALMQRTNVDGQTMLAPYNLISAWFWTYTDANGSVRPVRKIDLEAAYMQNGKYVAEIVSAFDHDQDGAISDSELMIDSQAKQDVVKARLESLGLNDVKIAGQIQPYSINHNVVAGENALSDCQACHNADSAVNRPMQLADYVPGGVTPSFVTDNNVSATGSIYTDNGALYYQPATSEDGLYVFGHNRVNWIDWLGSLIFVGTVFGVGAHGTMRYLASRKQPKTEKHLKAVHMYDAYERIWHWLQTLAIVILLFTGLIIHRPDLFGAFSFRYMVTIHNVLAALLAINAALSFFWHVASGEIRQYIPHPRGFIDEAFDQVEFYIKGIFKGEKHPFEKTKQKKLNPLQKVTYFGLLNVLLPLQGITGIIMWSVQKFPALENLFGGLPVLAPFHSLIAWLFATFIVAHVYLTTTGATVFEDIKAMITGWENVEVHE